MMDTPTRPVVVVDFDGVVCDGRDEALVVAFNAFNRDRGLSWWIDEPDDLGPRLKDRFEQYSHFVRAPREYWLVMQWLESETSPLNRAKFAARLSDHGSRPRSFEENFFAVRDEMRDKGCDAWSALHRFNPEARSGWGGFREENEVFVVTTRDLASIRHFNIAWSLGLDDTNLLTRERVVSKPAGIRDVAARCGVDAADLVFIDDHPADLVEAAAVGARCLWASWGSHSHENELPGFEHLDRLGDCVHHFGCVV